MSLFRHSGFAGRIGVAREDITPPIGIYARNWGASTHDVATGIHRPLSLTAITFQGEGSDDPLVLVSADLGWWRTVEDEWFIRGYLIEQLGLDAAQLLICLTHTHSGPSICRGDVPLSGGGHILAFVNLVRESALGAVREALRTAQPAVLEWTTGRCTLAQNRDMPDPNGDRVLCGFNPDEPADDTMLVGRITASGKNIATIVNYGCHPVTLAWENTLISPDYIGAMRELIESRTGGAPCAFLMGACGELAPRDQYTADTKVADRNGRQIGCAALAALEGMLPPGTALRYAGAVESGAALAVWEKEAFQQSGTLDARRIEVTLLLQNLPSVQEIEADLNTSENRVVAERLLRKLRIRKALGDGDSAQVPFWIWRIGNSVLVAQPNEPYSVFQTELRAAFPGTAICVVNVANGHMGYLPPAASYDQTLYQVWQSPFGRGSLERMIEAASEEIAAVCQGVKRKQ